MLYVAALLRYMCMLHVASPRRQQQPTQCRSRPPVAVPVGSGRIFRKLRRGRSFRPARAISWNNGQNQRPEKREGNPGCLKSRQCNQNWTNKFRIYALKYETLFWSEPLILICCSRACHFRKSRFLSTDGIETYFSFKSFIIHS